MKTWILLLITALFLTFSGCATHKKSVTSPPESLEKDYNVYLNQGSLLIRKADYSKAIDQINKAIALKPDASQAYNLLGIAYFFEKRYNLAIAKFEKALDLDSSYAQAYGNLGNAYLMRQQFEGAKEMFDKALSISPNLVSANYSLGALLLNQGKIEEGMRYISKGIELDPNFLERHKALVAEFASPEFNSPEAYFVFARAYAAIGDIEKTVEYLKKAGKAGFKDWYRIEEEKEFEKIRQDQRIKQYIKK
jgi:tetratricopeptide (TPR) repeat protein